MFNLTPATRKISTALAAAALALGAMTATALPARANSDDLAKILAGTAALVIIGSALNDRGRPGYYQPGPPVSLPRPVQPVQGWHNDRSHGGWHQPRPPQPVPRHGWAPPPPPVSCTVWINGQQYIRRDRDCIAPRHAPRPYDPRRGGYRDDGVYAPNR